MLVDQKIGKRKADLFPRVLFPTPVSPMSMNLGTGGSPDSAGRHLPALGSTENSTVSQLDQGCLTISSQMKG